MIIKLNPAEKAALFKENVGDGGFQSLISKLQSNFNQTTQELTLDTELRERVKRYSNDYANGGWQERLNTIFERHRVL